MLLEDFRKKQLVGELGVQTNLFNGELLPFLFHDSANAAFYMTVDALRRMQQVGSIGCNTYCIPSIGLWFMATESFISTIYKILQGHEKVTTGTSTLHAKKFIYKFDGIISFCSNGVVQASSLRNELNEFATFRNTLFHDLTFTRNPEVNHTLFAQQAHKLNEIDLMQAAIISLNTFTYFRNIFDGVDLMPNVAISNQFDKINTLFDEIIATSFTKILSCKGFSTALSLNLSNASLGHKLNIKPMNFVISHSGPNYLLQSSAKPFIVDQEFVSAESKRPMQSNKFGVPNYHR